MKFSKILIIIIPIIAFLILSITLLILYIKNNEESMTNMEASSILPVLYDSSLSNKRKITDLLGITVDDISYNKILNTQDIDSDIIISSIKNYIGSSVTFNTSSNDNVNSNNKITDSKLASTNATTTKPSTVIQKPFNESIKSNV